MTSTDLLKSYLASDPGNEQLACDLSDALVSQGEYPQAEQVLQSLPEGKRDAVGVRFRLGRLHLLFGRYAQAEQIFQDLMSDGHRSHAIGHDIAFAQLCQKRAAQADAMVDAAIGEFGDSPELLILRARIALMEKNYQRVNEALADAAALEPDHPVVRGLQALAALDAGDAEAAERLADACLATYPDQHEALLAAGTCRLWKREIPQAEMHFQRALSRFPNSGRALSGYAQVLLLQGRLEQAIPQLEHAVVAMPDHIGTWHVLAWAQLLQGELDASERSYRSAYALDRNFAETHGGLAVVAMLADRPAEAEDSMRRALKLDPKSVNGRYAKSLWLDSRGEADAASELMAEILKEGALPGTDLAQARRLSQGIRDRAHTRSKS